MKTLSKIIEIVSGMTTKTLRFQKVFKTVRNERNYVSGQKVFKTAAGVKKQQEYFLIFKADGKRKF